MAKFQDRFLLTYLEISPIFAQVGSNSLAILALASFSFRTKPIGLNFTKSRIRISLACCVNCSERT